MVIMIAIAIVAIVALVAGIASCVTSHRTEVKKSAQYEQDHYWESTVREAEDYFNVSQSYTDCVLAMILTESNGDECVDERHDIMQAWEGDGKKYILKGVKKQGVKKYTAEASVYAGVYEFKLCIKCFRKYMKYNPDPTDENDIALLSQGYNYGYLGWFTWLSENDLAIWNLADSKAYQAKIGGLGTAEHGGKVQKFYERLVDEEEEYAAEVAKANGQ